MSLCFSIPAPKWVAAVASSAAPDAAPDAAPGAAPDAAPGAAPCQQPASAQNSSGAVWASRGGVSFP